MNSTQVAMQAEGLSAELDGSSILRDVSVQIPRAAWTSIVGPNGAGKSSLLKALAGLLAHRGSIHLLGQLASSMPRRERARCLSWLGQSQTAPEDLRVWDVVMLGRLPHQAWLAAPDAEDHAAVQQALHATQAWEWRERSLGQLSGGERQRVLLARALAVQADIFLMDEPLANLDPPHQADWMALVRQLVAQGKTVVSVLHEISFALQADYLLIMQQGQLYHHGACDELSSHQALREVFDHRIAIHEVQGQWIALPQ
ncbi:ABC transporter ATP-binding protein [Undibacterium flavidum]|uniref:ABC transporter ATP-binding protein n=1 Tax=Undibacterium flavidum TaxID=2762297 RepID=A0ABR6YD16_9BURK|nr:ABC transporter ATP-binding protein [Undibacterium flavidum]MBC3874449.1 ABC transporter ATP-binding protein [Undibacterium flavidum]